MQKFLILFFTLGAYLFGNNEVQQFMSDKSWEEMELSNNVLFYGAMISACAIFCIIVFKKNKA